MELKSYTRAELCKELNISKYQGDRRKPDLLAGLDDFFNYEIVQQEGHNTQIIIKEIYKEYQPMPNKAAIRASLVENYTKKVDEIVQQNNRTNGSIIGRKLVKEHKQERNHKVETCQKGCRKVLNNNYTKIDKVGCVYLDPDKITYRELTDDERKRWKEILKHNLEGEQDAELINDYREGELTRAQYAEAIANLKDQQYTSALQEIRDELGLWPVLIPSGKLGSNFIV